MVCWTSDKWSTLRNLKLHILKSQFCETFCLSHQIELFFELHITVILIFTKLGWIVRIKQLSHVSTITASYRACAGIAFDEKPHFWRHLFSLPCLVLNAVHFKRSCEMWLCRHDNRDVGSSSKPVLHQFLQEPKGKQQGSQGDCQNCARKKGCSRAREACASWRSHHQFNRHGYNRWRDCRQCSTCHGGRIWHILPPDHLHNLPSCEWPRDRSQVTQGNTNSTSCAKCFETRH